MENMDLRLDGSSEINADIHENSMSLLQFMLESILIME